jgi:hypothetical protein
MPEATFNNNLTVSSIRYHQHRSRVRDLEKRVAVYQ